ncbi:MAG: glycosyltransferase, partial [Pseudomonadota bacterium]
MTDPRVSILLPVHNAYDTLGECLASIAAQTEHRYEVVAVNDHSADASPKLLRDAAAQDERIRVLDRPARGLVGALNAGLADCRAPLVARMDADDVMHPQRLACQLARMTEQPDLTVLATRVELLETDATGDGQREYVRWQNSCVSEQDMANRRYVESPLTHPSVMFRRDDILGAGAYRDGPFAEDYDLWLRLFESGNRIAKVPEVLLQWRDGATRLSRTDER